MTQNAKGVVIMKTDKLRGIIAEKNLHQTDVAKMLGVSNKTFYEKMKRGVFRNDEIAIMAKELGIKDVADIFLT